jgi:hypothetical protein
MHAIPTTYFRLNLVMMTHAFVCTGIVAARVMRVYNAYPFASVFSLFIPALILLVGRKPEKTWHVVFPWYFFTVNAAALGLTVFGCLARLWSYARES